MGRVRRRTVLIAAGALLAAPFASLAQRQSASRHIGVLSTSWPTSLFQQTLLDRLRRTGYEEGRNLVIEWRFSEGKNERLPDLAQELVRLNLELIVAHTNESIGAIKHATRTVPVVMHAGLLPVENGFVESLARPGGNITGAVWSGTEILGKVLETLKEAAPGAARVAMLWDPTYPFGPQWKAESDHAASILGMSLEYFYVARLDELEPALERIAAARPDALFVWPESIMSARAREIATFATRRKLVSISPVSLHVDHGGLLYYGPDPMAIFDRTAGYVGRILRGAKPADLPVEPPTKYELVINARTARTIGYRIPASLLARADRVIE